MRYAGSCFVAAAVLALVACGESSSPAPTGGTISPGDGQTPPGRTELVVPFGEVAREALGEGAELWSDRPGVVVFDYDRDGDLDIYLTNGGGHPNYLYRNDGDLKFTDVAREAGVAAQHTFSTGAIACDLDNDGFQDLYLGAWGDPNDGLDYRSPIGNQGNRDTLFRNNGDGTFRDITVSAFGAAVNVRSAASIACADVDGDGMLDIYVGNILASDFREFASASHPGHYNVLYMNSGDLTFTEIAEEAGVRGGQIVMRDAGGEPILFTDPETGKVYEGWDPSLVDALGNTVGDPTSQTHAVLFFDYDDDGDPDLWLANDGDVLSVFRNGHERRRGQVHRGHEGAGPGRGGRLDGVRHWRLRRRHRPRRLHHQHRLSRVAQEAQREPVRLVRIPPPVRLGHLPELSDAK